MTATTPERDGEEDSAVTPPATRADETGLMPAFDTKDHDACNGEITAGFGVTSGYPNLQTYQCAVLPAPTSDTDFLPTCPDVDNGDKGLKRKFVERGSQDPPEIHETPKTSIEPLKRPRDDADKDDNPRETKRPSPPPEPKSPKSPKKSAAAPRLASIKLHMLPLS